MSTPISKPLLETLQSSLFFCRLLCKLGVFCCVWGPLQLWALPKERELLSQCLCSAQDTPCEGVLFLWESGSHLFALSFLKTVTVILVCTITIKPYFQQAQSSFFGHHVCLQNHPLWWILPSRAPCYIFSWSSRTESWQTMLKHGPLDHRLVPKKLHHHFFSPLDGKLTQVVEWYFQKLKYHLL